MSITSAIILLAYVAIGLALVRSWLRFCALRHGAHDEFRWLMVAALLTAWPILVGAAYYRKELR